MDGVDDLAEGSHLRPGNVSLIVNLRIYYLSCYLDHH